MKKFSICLLLALALISWGTVDSAYGKKSRSSKSSRASVKKNTNKKSTRSRVARSRKGAKSRHRSRSTRAVVASAPRVQAGIPAERVSEIQNALIKSGHYQGPVTGEYDETTIQAVKNFQSKNSLPQTGLPSATLLKKLGVSKHSNDGYSVAVRKASSSEDEEKD